MAREEGGRLAARRSVAADERSSCKGFACGVSAGSKGAVVCYTSA